jgi:hypothetical protein
MNLRIRSTHGGQWKDEDFVSCSPLARLLALALRNAADDQGVFEWKPKLLKMELLPADDCDVVSLLSELVATKQITQFVAAEKKYGHIRNFSKFQRPRAPKNVYPAPPLAEVQITKCDAEPADVGCRMEDVKTEATASAKHEAIVDDEIKEFSSSLNPPVDPAEQLRRFQDWKESKGRRFRSDRAAFRNWLRKASDIARTSNGNYKPPTTGLQSYAEPWEHRLKGWRKSGFWTASWGPKPGDPNCRMPPELVVQDTDFQQVPRESVR